MSGNKISLKTQNLPALILFTIWSFALLLVCMNGTGGFWLDLQQRFASLSSKDGILMCLSPVCVLVVTGMLSPDIKSIMIFWRLKEVLPAHRAFSVHAKADSRIDLDRLKGRVKPWPLLPEDENRAWYRLYKAHESEVSVADAQRKFLLFRDLTVGSWLYAVVGIVITLAEGASIWACLSFLGIMTVHALVFNVICQNESLRFVKNVLAQATVA